MLFGFGSRRSRLSAAERFRLVHEVWLDRALRTGRAHPGIPKREVRLGGFETLMRSPGGRIWARRWWDQVLNSREAD
jgi:hypothetical protein